MSLTLTGIPWIIFLRRTLLPIIFCMIAAFVYIIAAIGSFLSQSNGGYSSLFLLQETSRLTVGMMGN